MIPGLLVVVPCGQKKVWDGLPNAGPTAAKAAYTGPPFAVNKAFAQCFGEEWFILSAKYGFIEPGFLIPGPYNVTFKQRSTGPVATVTLREQVRRLELSRFSTVVGLGGKEYRHAIEDAFEGTSVKLRFPFSGLPIGKAMQASKRAMNSNDPFWKHGGETTDGTESAPDKRSKMSYQLAKPGLAILGAGVNQICDALHKWFNSLPVFRFPFEESQIPRNGIYVLFEDDEAAHGTRRIVRVGTHTGTNQLRSRLVQHFVNEAKDRSIFRKNVGRCLLNRDNDPFLALWELDLTSRNARVEYAGQVDFEKQKQIERQVSDYIQIHFSFAVVEIPAKNKRLELESKVVSTVSLCSECGPTKAWLGRHSSKPKIQESGLWQVNELYKTPLSANDLLDLQGYGVGSTREARRWL